MYIQIMIWMTTNSSNLSQNNCYHHHLRQWWWSAAAAFSESQSFTISSDLSTQHVTSSFLLPNNWNILFCFAQWGGPAEAIWEVDDIGSFVTIIEVENGEKEDEEGRKEEKRRKRSGGYERERGWWPPELVSRRLLWSFVARFPPAQKSDKESGICCCIEALSSLWER